MSKKKKKVKLPALKEYYFEIGDMYYWIQARSRRKATRLYENAKTGKIILLGGKRLAYLQAE